MSRQRERDGDRGTNAGPGDDTGPAGWRDASADSSGFLGAVFGGAKGAPGGTGADAGANRADEARALVRSILDGLREPTTVVDTDGRITHVNSQALELYDCTASEATGAPPHALADDRGDATAIVAEAIEAGDDIQQREETVRVGGRETPLERTVTLLYDDDGNFDGAMLVDKDVTERNHEREKAEFLEAYQTAVLDDLQDNLARLADGDLTIDPTVPRPDDD